MQRRAALLTVLVLLLIGLSGCSYAESLSMHPAPNATVIAEHATLDTSDLDEEAHRLAVGAVNGSGPTVTNDYPPFTPDRPIAVDGTYYNVSWSAIDSRQVPTFVLEIEKDPTNTTGDRIAYRDLPAVDQHALPDPGSTAVTADETIATQAVYNESEQAASVLVSGPRYELVEFEDRTVRITVEGPSPKTIYTYRYEAEQVAANSDELATRLESTHLFTLSNLSTAQQEIVSDAIDGTYYQEQESDAWTRLVEQFDAADPVYGDAENDSDYVDGEYLVRYDGTVYWADIYGYTDGGA
ncbi:hypothetical protein [Halorhabdus sp. BNX81]|uniref:hypothetical protein n=1 Tax=Halorhabdus sp. BNX81 TaxID=2980181 RepID=UPI0023DD08C5|nr:hypothetical protein [Halorhabdus sp. BNX81]WEL20411.1 Uncharacterized protein HBNXHr_0336 [Halorhabdus sp. BNX81]